MNRHWGHHGGRRDGNRIPWWCCRRDHRRWNWAIIGGPGCWRMEIIFQRGRRSRFLWRLQRGHRFRGRKLSGSDRRPIFGRRLRTGIHRGGNSHRAGSITTFRGMCSRVMASLQTDGTESNKDHQTGKLDHGDGLVRVSARRLEKQVVTIVMIGTVPRMESVEWAITCRADQTRLQREPILPELTSLLL